MENKGMQCPNCHAFKLENAGTKPWGMAMLCFVFGTILLPLLGLGLLLYAYAIIQLIRLPSTSGKILCKSCGWEGKSLELTNLQSNV